ncbi:MAG: lecithin retinol acyltransferase family protein [Bacteroidetes bacterium]|nr:lecithin retinol acyltransferase family protein [Bacteroidota bacterium]
MNRNLQLVNHFNLKPGDRIVVPKSNWQLVQHHALYLGYDEFGNHYMCENVIGIGVRLTTVRSFFNGVKKVTRIESYTGNNYNRKIVVQNALSKLGQPYNLINYNCESFVNEVLLRRAQSNQVQNALGLLGLALLIAVVTRK